MLTPVTPPDPAMLLERIKVVGCRMALPSALAEDLIGDVVCHFWERGWERVPFPQPEKLDGWLRTCLNNWLRTKLGREADRRRIEQEFVRDAGPRQYPTPEEAVNADELRSLIMRIVREEARVRARKIFRLRRRDLSIQEIADAIGVSPSTVRQELNHVRNLLRRRLRELGY